MLAKVVTGLTIASLALGLVATIAAGVSSRVDDTKAKQQHEDLERQERQRDREHIRQLERIIVSEFPRWSPAIDWDNK